MAWNLDDWHRAQRVFCIIRDKCRDYNEGTISAAVSKAENGNETWERNYVLEFHCTKSVTAVQRGFSRKFHKIGTNDCKKLLHLYNWFFCLEDVQHVPPKWYQFIKGIIIQKTTTRNFSKLIQYAIMRDIHGCTSYTSNLHCRLPRTCATCTLNEILL